MLTIELTLQAQVKLKLANPKPGTASALVTHVDSWGTEYQQQVEKAMQPIKGSKKPAKKTADNASNASEQVVLAPSAEQPAPSARPHPRPCLTNTRTLSHSYSYA
jgi:hypothetical protein